MGFDGVRLDLSYDYWATPSTEQALNAEAAITAYKQQGLKILPLIQPFLIEANWAGAGRAWQVWRRPPSGTGDEAWTVLLGRMNHMIDRFVEKGYTPDDLIIQFGNEPAWGGNGGPQPGGPGQGGALDGQVTIPAEPWITFARGGNNSIGDGTKIPETRRLGGSATKSDSKQDSYWAGFANVPPGKLPLGYGTWDTDDDWQRMATLTGKTGYADVRGLHSQFAFLLDGPTGFYAKCRSRGFRVILAPFLGRGTVRGLLADPPDLPHEIATLWRPVMTGGHLTTPLWIRSVDGFSCHNYTGDQRLRQDAGPRTLSALVRRYGQDAKDMLTPYLDGKPLLFTEFGYDRSWTGVDPFLTTTSANVVLSEQERGEILGATVTAMSEVADEAACLFAFEQLQAADGSGEDFGLIGRSSTGTRRLSNGAYAVSGSSRTATGPPSSAPTGTVWRSSEPWDVRPAG